MDTTTPDMRNGKLMVSLMGHARIRDLGDHLLSGGDLSNRFTPEAENKLIRKLHVNLTFDELLEPSLREKVAQVEEIMREKEISTPWRSQINWGGKMVRIYLTKDSSIGKKPTAPAKLQIK